MRIFKIILLLIFISPSIYAAQSKATKELHVFEEYLKNKNPENIEVNTRNLAECSALFYAFAVRSQDQRQSSDSIYNSKILSEYLYVLAIKRNKILAAKYYNSEKEKYLRRISDNKNLDVTSSNQIHCAKVALKSKENIQNYLHDPTRSGTNSDMRGIWIDYYAKWENGISTRVYTQNAEVVNFDSDGNATLVFIGLHKTSDKIILDFTAPYLLAKGKWKLINNQIAAEFKVIKNTSLKYNHIPIETEIKYKYSLLGERLLSNNNVLYKLETSKYRFIDKIKLTSKASKNEQKEIDRIIYILDKDIEITRKILRGNEKLSDKEKEILNIDIDKEFLDFTEDEIKERDKSYSNILFK